MATGQDFSKRFPTETAPCRSITFCPVPLESERGVFHVNIKYSIPNTVY